MHSMISSSSSKVLPKNNLAKFIMYATIYSIMDTNKQYTWWLKALSGADEVQARRFAGAIALEIGWGGISKVEELTGMSHSTISRGIEELKTSEKLEQPERLRTPGGGRSWYHCGS